MASLSSTPAPHLAPAVHFMLSCFTHPIRLTGWLALTAPAVVLSPHHTAYHPFTFLTLASAALHSLHTCTCYSSTAHMSRVWVQKGAGADARGGTVVVAERPAGRRLADWPAATRARACRKRADGAWQRQAAPHGCAGFNRRWAAASRAAGRAQRVRQLGHMSEGAVASLAGRAHGVERGAVLEPVDLQGVGGWVRGSRGGGWLAS